MKYSYLLILLLLSSCYTERFTIKPDEKNSKQFNSDYYSSVDVSDPVSFIGAGFFTGIHSKTPVLDLGIRLQYGNFSSSIIDGQLALRTSFMESKLLDENGKISSNAPKLFTNLVWSYPLKVQECTGKANIPVGTFDNYTSIVYDPQIRYLRIISADLGIGYDYITKNSSIWSEHILEQSDINLVTNPKNDASIVEGNLHGLVGVRYSFFMNSQISGQVEGVNYKGRRKEIFDFRLRLKPLIYAQVSDYRYEYYLTSSPQETLHGTAIGKEYLKKHFLGLDLTFSYTAFSVAPGRRLACSVMYSVGIDPGYGDSYLQNFYHRMGLIVVGMDFMSKRY